MVQVITQKSAPSKSDKPVKAITKKRMLSTSRKPKPPVNKEPAEAIAKEATQASVKESKRTVAKEPTQALAKEQKQTTAKGSGTTFTMDPVRPMGQQSVAKQHNPIPASASRMLGVKGNPSQLSHNIIPSRLFTRTAKLTGTSTAD